MQYFAYSKAVLAVEGHDDVLAGVAQELVDVVQAFVGVVLELVVVVGSAPVVELEHAVVAALEHVVVVADTALELAKK